MITQRELKYFDVAKAMAALSTWSEAPSEQVGAIVVLRNEIIATGYNRRKTHPFQSEYAIRAGRPAAIYPHAEISALSKLRKNQHDFHLAKIFVFRETRTGLGLARPCEICSLAISEYGIQHVYYTTILGYAYERWTEKQ